MNLIEILYIFMTALFAALIMVPFLMRWALDSGAVDKPDERKVHREAMPRLGGIAITLSLFFALLVHADIDHQIRGILAGTLVMFITGMVDDLYGLSAQKKFIGQIAACLITIVVADLHVFYLGNLFGTGPVLLPPWLAYPFTVFAVVGVINAINLIDGLDGLAGGVSVIALTTFGLLGFLAGNLVVMLIAAALLGALVGFLKYNFYPARIFMGDAGSLAIGFALAFLAISLTQARLSAIDPMVPVVVLGLPIVDTLWVMVRRTVHGGHPFAPDNNHVHHKFLNLGYNHRFTVLIIYGISFFWAIFAVLSRNRPAWLLLVLYLGISCVFYVLLRHLLRHRERFKPILAKDSASSLLKSKLFARLADSLGFLEPLLMLLVTAYLVLATLSGAQLAHPATQVVAILLAASIALIYCTRDTRNDFVLLSFYFAGLVFALLIHTPMHAEKGTLIRDSANLLFIGIAALVFLRLTLRQPGTLFFTSVDYLFFGLNILFAVFVSQIARGNLLFPLVLAKAIVLYLAIKVVMVGSRRRVDTLVWALLGSLGVLVVRGAF